jgi:cellulose synthase/poly-beta-1,6-N-acetylglucosamine synthase-like glycosyltransferase
VLYSYKQSRAFELFQALEFISLLATSAGAAALNRPLFCNAANMAFTRKTFKKLNDPFSSDTPSGDDTLLLLSIKKKYPGNIQFNDDLRAMVETAPEKTLKNFWNQRKRWVSKSRYYRDFDILATAFIVFGANLLLIVFLILMIFNPMFINYFITFFLFKLIVDGIFLFPVIFHYKRYQLLKAYLPSQLLYPFYVAASALGGKLSGFKWKSRHYHVTRIFQK